MKQSKYIIVIFTFLFYSQKGVSQVLNWYHLDSIKHIVHASFGLDFSVAYGLGYGYKLNTKLPIVLNINLSVPAGENIIDDFKTKAGLQVLILNHNNFRGNVAIKGIYRKFDSELVRLQNFGSEVKGAFGYYRSRWFLAGELSFDKAIITHFKHTEKYKQDIYSDVKDGWYNPATGGTFRYGAQFGYSFHKVDLTLDAGKDINQDFKTVPTLPFYFKLGVNLRY